jgi:formamidopyrimidine-DNA glycosylase
MPELPEVETIRRQLAPRLSGRLVLEADSHPSAKFTPARDATGARLGAAGRRGKFLLIPTTGRRELVIHLGMTGTLSLVPEADLDDPYLRAWWRLGPADGAADRGTGEIGTGEIGAGGATETLLFRDVRRFGRIRFVPAGDYSTIPALATAGPEPFDPALDGKQFWQLLQRSRRRLKTQLLSQRPIAGVGNIYADEALWLASVNPRVTRLSRPRATELLAAIRHVLGVAIDNGGTTLRDYRNLEGGSGDNLGSLAAYGRGGQPCLRCGERLTSAPIDARTTTWCPHCQRR